MKVAAGVDGDRLAGHGIGAAHRDHHGGAVILVGGPFQHRGGGGIFDLLAPEIGCRSRVLRRPGATQLTRVSGANATAMQRVRWIRPAFDTAYAIDEPVGPSPATEEIFTMRPRPWAFMAGAPPS